MNADVVNIGQRLAALEHSFQESNTLRLEKALNGVALELRSLNRQLDHLRVDLEYARQQDVPADVPGLEDLVGKVWSIIRPLEHGVKVDKGVQNGKHMVDACVQATGE